LSNDHTRSGRRLRRLRRDAELLLQARRRCGVLEHQALLRINVVVRLLCHQRDFVKARQDELKLSRIPIYVADGENSRNAGFERRSLDRDELVVLELEAPLGDRPELHGQPEERQERVAGELVHRAVIALDGGFAELALGTVKLRDLTEQK